MGTITRQISLETTPAATFQQLIPYSRKLVTSPGSYVPDNPYAPIWRGKYDYIDANIEGTTPDNAGVQLTEGYQITFNIWDIDAIGGIRIGDQLLLTNAIPAPVSGIVTDVTQTQTQLIVLLDIASLANETDITGISLYPVGRGNFGPIELVIGNNEDDTETYSYQPPTTYRGSGENVFIIDASEALKTWYAKHGQLNPNVVPMLINSYLDDVMTNIGSNDNCHNAVLPCGVSPLTDEIGVYINQRYPSYYNDQYDPELPALFNCLFDFPFGRVGFATQMLVANESGELSVNQNVGPGQAITCEQLEILSLDKNWVGLLWKNWYGGYDAWFFKYGQQIGAQHSYLAGESQMQRIGWQVTQTNRGLPRRSWSMSTGMFPKQYSTFFAQLKESNEVYLIPNSPSLPTFTGPDFYEVTNISVLQEANLLVRVNVQDDDWTDNVFGQSLTSYSVTVIESELGQSYQS